MLGKSIGPYEITEEIGRGGMATVYRAYHKKMDRHVAVKLIRPSILSDKTIRDRFQREAKLIAKLEHPHLLPVHDFDGQHDPPFIVMRFLEGGTLKQVIELGGLPTGEMLYLLRQVASALDYSHRQGIVHRDLKPSNIMIDKEGNAFVADFGIARTQAVGKDLTETGAAVGTPGYMSPEQALSQEGIDLRADIYSLGVIIYEMLAGKPPYDLESPIEVMMAHIQADVPNILEDNPKLPKGVNKVIQSAMAKDKNDRYPTAGALIHALADALNTETSDAPAKLREITGSIALEQLEVLKKSKEDKDSSSTLSRDQQRQLTAVYMDLTELAEILYEMYDEQESVRAKIDPLWERIAEIALEYDGELHSRTDEVGIALWGAETTRENDPEQAIRAALDMKAAALQTTKDIWGNEWEATEETPLPFLAGITTGPVLLEMDADTGSRTASGPTITLAGRLKDATPSGEI
ncbi:MAG: protein kinase, partial [Anaerolineae bacterium]|nr:protein kinase [Anaerolineae bacterium]